MSLRFLLDTHVLSEPARLAPDLRVIRRLEEHQQEIGIAAPSWHELLFGCELLPRSVKRERIEKYLFSVVTASFPVLPYDSAAAEEFAALDLNWWTCVPEEVIGPDLQEMRNIHMRLKGNSWVLSEPTGRADA